MDETTVLSEGDRERVVAAGLVPEAVEGLLARARREVEEGLLPSCQLALARDGEVVVEAAFGAQDTDRFAIFSATKAVTGGGVWRLLSDGRLRRDTRVSEVLDGFGHHGKDPVTVEMLLTHTAGFPRAPLGPAVWSELETRQEQMRRWRINWEPGTRYEYHPTSAHWVLAELISAVTGEDHRTYLRSAVLDPLGCHDLVIGSPDGVPIDRVRPPRIVGERPSAEELAEVFGTAVDLDELMGEVTDEAKELLGDPAVLAVGIPGGGGVSTAGDLARFYQGLLHDPAGLWDPDVLQLGTATVCCDLPDPLTGIPSHRTLGLILAGDDGHSSLRGFGRTISARGFGHGGAGGQIAFADPATGLSFAYLTDGHDRHLIREARRTTAVASRAAACADRS